MSKARPYRSQLRPTLHCHPSFFCLFDGAREKAIWLFKMHLISSSRTANGFSHNAVIAAMKILLTAFLRTCAFNTVLDFRGKHILFCGHINIAISQRFSDLTRLKSQLNGRSKSSPSTVMRTCTVSRVTFQTGHLEKPLFV